MLNGYILLVPFLFPFKRELSWLQIVVKSLWTFFFLHLEGYASVRDYVLEIQRIQKVLWRFRTSFVWLWWLRESFLWALDVARNPWLFFTFSFSLKKIGEKNAFVWSPVESRWWIVIIVAQSFARSFKVFPFSPPIFLFIYLLSNMFSHLILIIFFLPKSKGPEFSLAVFFFFIVWVLCSQWKRGERRMDWLTRTMLPWIRIWTITTRKLKDSFVLIVMFWGWFFPEVPPGGLTSLVGIQKWGFSCKVQRRPPADIFFNESLPPKTPLRTPCSWLPWPSVSRKNS